MEMESDLRVVVAFFALDVAFLFLISCIYLIYLSKWCEYLFQLSRLFSTSSSHQYDKEDTKKRVESSHVILSIKWLITRSHWCGTPNTFFFIIIFSYFLGS